MLYKSGNEPPNRDWTVQNGGTNIQLRLTYSSRDIEVEKFPFDTKWKTSAQSCEVKIWVQACETLCEQRNRFERNLNSVKFKHVAKTKREVKFLHINSSCSKSSSGWRKKPNLYICMARQACFSTIHSSAVDFSNKEPRKLLTKLLTQFSQSSLFSQLFTALSALGSLVTLCILNEASYYELSLLIFHKHCKHRNRLKAFFIERRILFKGISLFSLPLPKWNLISLMSEPNPS